MEINQLLTPNQIIKSNRRSISLIIKNNGDFIVRAPLKINEKKIFEFIKLKTRWIVNKRIEALDNRPKLLNLENDEIIKLLGVEYVVSIQPISRAKICENKIILPAVNSKETFVKFLKKYAKKHIENRTAVLAKKFNLSYCCVSISSAKTCWGSCSFNNKLHFTYKLMFCPPEVVDYVILHELCHTKVKNHSLHFWNLVSQYNPNYKEMEKWLKNNKAIIECI